MADHPDAPPPSFSPRRRPARPAEAGEPRVVSGRGDAADGAPHRSATPHRSAPPRPSMRGTQPPPAPPVGRPVGGTRRGEPAAPPPAIAPRGRATTPPPPAAYGSSGHDAPPPAGHAPRRTGAAPGGAPRPRRRRRTGRTVLVVVLVLLLAWPVGLLIWANARLDRVEALSGASSTTGTTYLLAGSDARGELVDDATEGSRTDTIMLLHVPSSGPTALISLPRDTYVQIPDNGANKLNAAYSFGGPALLVRTVEELSGLTVDHYVEIGLDGVAGVVDAVGGVELCLDYDVDDWRSKLEWEAGCHLADGPTALAFSRMRYADPEGDIGRARRQQEVIQAVASSVADPTLAVKPGEQVSLLRAGTDALAVSQGTSVIDLGRLALAFRAATGPDGVRGTPPIATVDYRPGGVGSAVLLDEALAPTFWSDLRDGALEPGSTVGGLPGS